MDLTDRLQGTLPFVDDGKPPSEPFLQRAARWASGLSYRDVPKPIRRSATTQLTGSVAAAIWTSGRPIGHRIEETIGDTDGDGRATFLGGWLTTPERAAFGNAALASALNFDDLLLGGATGPSSVFVPLAYAEATDANGRRALVAQIAANEIAGRLGAAVATGPFDEERITSIHAVGAAVGRGVIEDVEADTLADALGTALSQPTQPLERSALGSETGVWNVSDPIRTGIAAIDSARNGIAGRHDLIESEGGFLDSVCDRPSPAYLSGLGDRWHTATLSVKQSPGSVFLAAPFEAATEARGRFDRGRTALRRVDVHVPAASIAADVRAQRYSDENGSRTVPPWSIPRGVGTALVEGRPTPKPSDRRKDRVRRVAERVRIHHDPELTVAGAGSAGQSGVTLGGSGRLAPIRAARTLGPKATARHLPSVLRSGRPRSPPEAFEAAERRFGARIVVTTAAKRTVEATIDRPSGFAGAPLAEKRAIARRKLREGMATVGVDGPTARERSRELLSIADADPVSLGTLLDVIDRE